MELRCVSAYYNINWDSGGESTTLDEFPKNTFIIFVFKYDKNK